MKILLIIPAYNEEANLPHLLKELKQYPEYDCVVVDDCSKDNTRKVAQRFGVPCVSLPVNLGLSGAVQTGLLYGVENNYDVCVQIDGDGQHVPSEIAKLIEKIATGYDIVIGSRFLENTQSYEQTFARKIGAKYISFLIKIFSGLVLTDPTSGMRAFNRKVFSRMAFSTNERPEPDTVLAYARTGAQIIEVQVEMRDRLMGESYLTPLKAIRYMVENSLSFLFVVLKTKRKRGGR